MHVVHVLATTSTRLLSHLNHSNLAQSLDSHHILSAKHKISSINPSMASASCQALHLTKPKLRSFDAFDGKYRSVTVSLPPSSSVLCGGVFLQRLRLWHSDSDGFAMFSRLNKVSIGCQAKAKGNDALIETKEFQEVEVQTSIWTWKHYSIRYQFAGNSGPALVLIHGFGANSDHWRKNIPSLAKSHRVYAIDLIGYGYSDKPNPRDFGDDTFYTFETWGSQINDFCTDVVKDEAFFICNSIGGVVGLQAAVVEPKVCKGIMLLNISLRMLHIKKQPSFGKPFIRSFQGLLRNTALGKFFFKAVATPTSVRNILCQCYHDTSQVTDELVQKILRPGLEPGAVDVFLEFICYSGGPLPEELLPQVKCPVLIAWGDKDPWEPIDLGRAYGGFESVEDFIVLPNVGHCPQDEAPHLVNPLIETFVARHETSKDTTAANSI